MAAQDSPRRNWLAGALGLVGFSAIAGVLVTITVAPAVALTGIAASSAIGVFDSIPDYFELDELPERNVIMAHDAAGGWSPIANIYDQNREQVAYTQIAPVAVDALIAGEDRRFYEHGGVDLPGVIRAALGNLGSGDVQSGASTLTMQLVKQTFIQEAYNLPTEEERNAAYKEATALSFDRKLKEMKIAIALEKRYTKKEILTAYLNIAYFGAQTYGIQAASQRYFGINASNLNLEQSASLIAIVQYPDLRNLYVDADDPEGSAERLAANQARRDYIFTQMLAEGYITQEQFDAVYETEVTPEFVANGKVPQQGCRTATAEVRWFCDYVVKSVKDFTFLGDTVDERLANWKRGGYTLYTTMDIPSQVLSQQVLWSWAPNDITDFQFGATVVTVEPGSGKVRVMAQNKYFDDAFVPDNAVNSTAVNFNTSYSYGNSTGFQPGSTYKLFTLTQWLIAGHGVNEVINGGEGLIPSSAWHDRCNGTGVDYQVTNDAHESGSYTVRAGTWGSINGVFLRMATKLDLCDIAELAAKMGVIRGDETPLNTHPSDVIGTNEVTPLSMATAYSTIAGGGKTCQPIIVEQWAGADGITQPGQAPKCVQTVDPDIAATVADVLVGNTANGTGQLSDPGDGIPMLSKTGTTNDSEQTWVAASTTTNTTIVWTGNITGHFSMYGYYDPRVPSAIRLVRHDIMRQVMGFENGRFGGTAFPAPSGKYETGGKVSVPNVSNLGLTYEQAKKVLEDVGFAVEDGGPSNSDQPLGTIADQTPKPGESVGAGTPIVLGKSLQNMTVIPDVTGTLVSEAADTLESANYPLISVAGTCPAGYKRPKGMPASVSPTDERVSDLPVDAMTPAGATLQITKTTTVILSVTLDQTNPLACVPEPPPT
jgi:membrane peptidoglycan carboxypeptidase